VFGNRRPQQLRSSPPDTDSDGRSSPSPSHAGIEAESKGDPAVADNIDLDQPLDGLIYEKRDHVAYLTLNRPERGNALAGFMAAPVKAIREMD
jgi:hypothetical protein